MGAWDGRERKSLSVRKQVSSLCGCEEKLSSVCFTLNGNRAREGRQLPGYAAQKADYPRGVVWWRKALWISFLFRAEWKLFVDSKFHSISPAPQAKHRVSGVCFGSHLEVSSALEPMRRRSP